MSSDLYKPLAIASTTALGLFLIIGSPKVLKPLPAVLGTIGGFGLVVSGLGLATKEELEPADYANALKLVCDGINELFAARDVAETIKALPLHRLPDPLRNPLQAFAEVAIQDREWRRHFRKASSLVAGVKNSGKTVYLHLDAAEFIEDTQGKGYLRIYDPNYGKRDNFWFYLPIAPVDFSKRSGREIIFTEREDFVSLVDEFWKEKERRRVLTIAGKGSGFEQWKLIADEFNRTIEYLKDKLEKAEFDSLWRKIKDLLFEAHGFGIFFTAGVQTLAVGEIAMNEATQKQMNAVLLGSTALDPDEVARVAAKGQADKLIQRVKQVRKMPDCQYACIVKLDGQEIRVEVVPSIDPNGFKVELPETTLTPAEQWAESQREQITMVANGHISKTAFWKSNGEGRQSTDNEYYQAFNVLLEQIKQEVKSDG